MVNRQKANKAQRDYYARNKDRLKMMQQKRYYGNKVRFNAVKSYIEDKDTLDEEEMIILKGICRGIIYNGGINEN